MFAELDTRSAFSMSRRRRGTMLTFCGQQRLQTTCMSGLGHVRRAVKVVARHSRRSAQALKNALIPGAPQPSRERRRSAGISFRRTLPIKISRYTSTREKGQSLRGSLILIS